MSRRGMSFHCRYHEDALVGYRKLSLEQRGAYTTILDLIYDEGGPIERNDRWLAGELNCSLRKVKVLLSELLQLRKIYITSGGKISNHRAETEIEKALNISRKRAENGSKRKPKAANEREKPNKINNSVKQLLDKCSAIPNTISKYKNNYPSVEEDGQGAEDELCSGLADPPAMLVSPRLIDSLDRRTGAGDVAAMAARRSRRGGSGW